MPSPSLRAPAAALAVASLLALASCSPSPYEDESPHTSSQWHRRFVPASQTPDWSEADRDFFLNGSMSTEVVPEAVFRAWLESEPGLFPSPTLANFGAVEGKPGDLPIGFSRRPVAHLGGLPSLGINCAACHASEVVPAGGGTPTLILGTAAPFDAEAFFGAVVVAMVKTADPEGMKRFLPAYARALRGDEGARAMAARLESEGAAVAAAVAEDPFANRGAAAGTLHRLTAAELDLVLPGTDSPVPLPDLARALLRLLHNMRAALHLPDVLPASGPPPSGPGRNDAFGLLSLSLLGVPQEPAPVKFGIVWNVERRRWVHWDGNTPSPMARNFLAAVGLGAPMVGNEAIVDIAVLRRQTDLSETIRPPQYPWPVDAKRAERGKGHYEAACARCHDGPESDARLFAVPEVGTDPARARAFTAGQAEGFNAFLKRVRVKGWDAAREPAIRSTGKYWAADLAGVWARAPYLHNGSVRTLADLLTAPADREKSWRRGSREYDRVALGFTDAGAYVLDTTAPGNSSAGHDYGTGLSPDEKRDLLEYLKTR
ncbi:MAG: hypothetical protein HUU15_17335 [Candidatus Brocadiae bacterium]|nr:hypothetical protein [Candidatus Brocadiia bacterium]